MTERSPHVALLALFLATAASGAGRPVERACGSKDALSLEDAVQEALVKRAADEARGRAPLAAAGAQESGPPSNSSEADSPVDKAEIPWLAAFGIGSDLVSQESGVLTVQINPFGFLQALQPKYQNDDQLYQAKRYWRRLGGTISLGGMGEKFDRDGDGQEDEALKAGDLQDIINWEVQYQLVGSRDRREGIAAFLRGNDAELAAIVSDFGGTLGEEAEAYRSLGLNAAGTACYERKAVLEFLLAPEQEGALNGFAAAAIEFTRLAGTMKAKYEEIDRNLILTFAVGGISRQRGFGRDEWKAALRMAGTRKGVENAGTHNLNLEWSRIDSLDESSDPEKLKLGYEYSRLVLRGTKLSRDGATLSASGAYENFRHVPDAKHSTKMLLNAKLDLPVSTSMSIPLSVTWANHKDLIDGEDELQGHFGFSVDLSKLKDLVGKNP